MFTKLVLACVLLCVTVVLGQKPPNPDEVFTPLWNSFSDEQKKEAREIMQDKSLTKAEVKKKMDAWVEKLDDEKVKVIDRLFVLINSII